MKRDLATSGHTPQTVTHAITGSRSFAHTDSLVSQSFGHLPLLCSLKGPVSLAHSSLLEWPFLWPHPLLSREGVGPVVTLLYCSEKVGPLVTLPHAATGSHSSRPVTIPVVLGSHSRCTQKGSIIWPQSRVHTNGQLLGHTLAWTDWVNSLFTLPRRTVKGSIL